MKILIIDDEKGILRIYSDKLQASGYEALTSENGDDGIKKAIAEQPDLILLDIIMPKINGLDVLKSLKLNDSTKAIPIVLLTNLPEEMSADKARELGATDYLVKAEHDPSEIIERIKQILATKNAS